MKVNNAYLFGIGLAVAVALPGGVGVASAHFCRGEPGDMTHPDGCDPHNCSNAATTSAPMLPEPTLPILNDVLPLLPPMDPLSIPMNDAGPLRDAVNKAGGEVFGLPGGVSEGEDAPWHWHTVKHASGGDTFKHHCASWGRHCGRGGHHSRLGGRRSWGTPGNFFC